MLFKQRCSQKNIFIVILRSIETYDADKGKAE